MSRSYRVPILLATLPIAVLAMATAAPIAQDPAYHAFADTRLCFGLPNFGDAASNIGFAAAGAWGLWTVRRLRGQGAFIRSADAMPYLAFFAAVATVSLGSAWYHLAPDNDRLFWDRLPMTVAFMALFTAFLADRVHPARPLRWVLPVLLACGVLSLVYWHWTEAQGRGDLRFYALVQFYPLVAMPLILWLFPKAHYTAGRYLFWVLFWYALAKGLEAFDYRMFALLGNLVSGHSLKHLAAAVAAAVVARMLMKNAASSVAAATPGDVGRPPNPPNPRPQIEVRIDA